MHTNNARKQRAEEILATGKIDRQGHIFFVPSQSGKPRRSVIFEPTPSCDCPDFELRQLPCKHILAVQLMLEYEKSGKSLPAPAEPPLRTKRPTYPQDWPNYNLAQTNEKDHFQSLLADLCRNLPDLPAAKTGRKRIPLSDALFAAVFKVYSTLSARRFMCDLEEAHRRSCIQHVLCFNSVLGCLENPDVKPILFDLIQKSALPLREVDTDFAVDSSGFMTSRYIRWYDQKYGSVKQQAEWVKVHIITGVKTNVIAAVEILDKHAGDAPRLPPLVRAAAKGFRVAEVSVDAAYGSRENCDAVAEVGGTLYAAFRSNTTGGVGGLFEKMFHLFCLNKEEYLRHYHKRSNVESTFSMVKRKFGDSLRSKTDTAMVNEALAKLLCHNIVCVIHEMYELGIEPIFGATPPANEPRNILPMMRPATR
jgi:transposase